MAAAGHRNCDQEILCKSKMREREAMFVAASGDLLPKSEEFYDVEQAIDFALKILPSNNFPFYIMDADDGEIIALVYGGVVWKPAAEMVAQR